MFNRHVIFIILTVRDHYVEYLSFMQKFIEFNHIYF